MIITVVGLGKIGLPLAVQFAAKGHRVLGADINPGTVELVNRGIEPFPGEAELGVRLRSAIDEDLLSATTDTESAVRQSEAVVIVVPLYVDDEGTPDFTGMDAATEAVAAGLQPGTLVSYETTLPVGTTRQRFLPRLADRSGLDPARFHVVFSPERVLTGRVFADLRRYPKLVGGVDPASTAVGRHFYRAVLDFDERPDLETPNGVWDMGSAEAAEMAKLAETTYRDVNIGLANQFARFADDRGFDIHRIIAACNTQPYSHIHSPGIAVGGHCIPVYPRFYLWNDPSATVVAAARAANAGMPAYAVDLLERLSGPLNGLRVAVLGISYRGGVKETAFSGIFPTVAELQARGATVLVHDPMYDDEEIRAFGFEPYELGRPCDAAIIQADHHQYRSLSGRELPGRAIVDGRRVLDPSAFPDSVILTIGGGSPLVPTP